MVQPHLLLYENRSTFPWDPFCYVSVTFPRTVFIPGMSEALVRQILKANDLGCLSQLSVSLKLRHASDDSSPVLVNLRQI